MSWTEIGAELGISGEHARKIALKALVKIRKRAPWLAEVYAAAMSLHDRRSPAQRMVDEGCYLRGDYQRNGRIGN